MKIKQFLKNFGPGFVWAVAAIGSGELIISTKAGAEYGFAFIWILWLGVFIDFWLQRGIMEVTILTGRPITDLWEERKWGKAVSFFWVLYFLLMVGGLAGLFGLAGIALKEIFPFLPLNIWPVLIAVFGWLVFNRGQYKLFEKTMLIFGAVLLVGVITVIVLSPPAASHIFDWKLPAGSSAFLVFLALLGWSAGSGPELMIPYSSWLLEKKRSAVSENKKDIQAAKSHLKIMRWDALGGFLAVGLIASVFLAAGATILHPRGIILDGFGAVKAVSLIFTNTFGSWAFWPFIIPIAAAFIAASIGIINGVCLALASSLRSLFGQKSGAIENIRKTNLGRLVSLIYVLLALGIFFFLPNPVLLVAVAGAISALATPVLAVFILLALLKKIPADFRPGKFYVFSLTAGIIIHIILLVEAVIRFL